jgi:hypothetical protein
VGRPVLGVHMDKREPDTSGDYGYDMAHDVPRREQTAAHSEPDRPGRASPAPGKGDRMQDYEYDEAHDF